MPGNKVTAGIPGLSPDVRNAIDGFWRKKDTQKTIMEGVNSKIEEAKAPDNGRDRTVAQGRFIGGDEFIRKLRILAPGLVCERSINAPERFGIYKINHSADRGMEYLGVSGEYDPMPEFDVIGFRDEEKLQPYILRRGWRTILARLIRLKAVGSGRVERVFGLPSVDSERWHRFTK